MPEWDGRAVGEALIAKRVDAEGMDGLLNVFLLGGGRPQEDANGGVEKVGADISTKRGKPHSQQLDESFERMAAGEYVPPTYDPLVWAQTPKLNTRLARCIHTFARNTVGLGWSIEPLHPHSARETSADRSTPFPAQPASAGPVQAGVVPEKVNGPMAAEPGAAPAAPAAPMSPGASAGSPAVAPVDAWDGWAPTAPAPDAAGGPGAEDGPLAAARVAEAREIEWQTEALRDLFTYPNDRMPFTEIMFLVKVDEEATGNGYLEIVRNNGRKIAQLHHVPATTIRRRLSRGAGQKIGRVEGYVQIRGSEKRYFKEFGDQRAVDARTGTAIEKGQTLDPENRATEIIHFPIYDPMSQYYGAPRYVPAATAIAGNRHAAIRNVSFFENDAVPRMALLVSGGRLTNDSMQQIEDFVRGKARGTDQAHRVMIIQVEPHKVGFQQQNKVMVELKPLTVGVTEDASFSQYRKDNDEEIREIFGLGQIFFTSEGANRANAQVAREITNEQEFEPDRLAKEYLLNQTLVCDLLQHEMTEKADLNHDGELDEEELRILARQRIRVRFRFARMTLSDPLDAAKMDQVYAQLGAVTPNEMRERLGKPPFPKEFFFANKPLPIAMAELSAGLALAIALDPQKRPPQQSGGPEGGDGAVDVTPDMPQRVPGVSAPRVTAAARPYADGIEVVGGPEEAPVATGAPARSSRHGWRGAEVASGLNPMEGMRIASELLADARRLAMIGADLMEGRHGP